jgi:hypothetical protein
MRKFKLGLQKEVSKIFTGISVPGKKSPGPPGGEQAKTGAADGKITSRPAVQTHQAPPAAHTPPALQPPSVSPSPKDVITPPPAVTPTQQVVTPAPAATAPSQVVPPAPVAAAKTVSVSKPVPQNPRPFSIPEPPQSKTPAVKSPVYEPPIRKQGVYEPPPPSVLSAAGPSKQQKVEIISTGPGWQTSVFKILRPITDKFLTPKPGISPLRQKATLVIVAILPLVLIFALIKVFVAPAKGGAKSAKTVAADVVKNQINWEIPPLLPENFRDPMVFGSSGQNQQEHSGPVVKGIVYSEDNPCAVVGERIVSAGDTVNGVTVVKINPDSVEFAAGDKKWTQKVER